ncbi:MAG: CAP domain-containing protein, partial [bacterium]
MRYLCLIVAIFLCVVAVAAENRPSVATVPPPLPVATLTPMWTTTQFTGLDEVESEILRMTNEARARKGLPALAADERLRTAARQHSQEMSEKKYFEHESTEVKWHTPAQRCYLAGFWSQVSGENIAMLEIKGILTPACPNFATPQQVARRLVDNWLNSPPHYKNIMNPEYKLLGVGASLKDDKVNATQEFGKELTIIEKATLTPYTGEQVAVEFKIKAKPGLELNLWVNQAFRQTYIAPDKDVTVTTYLSRKCGLNTCIFAVGSKAAFQTKVDTDADQPVVKLDNYFRDPEISFQEAKTAIVPTNGLKLQVAATVPPGTGDVTITCNDEYKLILTPDNANKINFNLDLPQSDKPYRIGVYRGGVGEHLLFIDTTKPLIEAFQGRP